MPLERDEGEYAYAGQLMLQGIAPYEHLYSMKLPGIYASYAGILAVFGPTQRGIHLGLLLVNMATAVAIFFLGQRLVDRLAGAVAAASFTVLSTGTLIQGTMAHAEHFVILPAVGGLLLLLRSLDEERQGLAFWSGCLLGIGFLMKQHGGAFIAFGLVYAMIDRLRNRPLDVRNVASWCATFVAGAALPYALTCIVFASIGSFDKFWFWTVEYAIVYASKTPLHDALRDFGNKFIWLVRSAPLIWALAFLGLMSILWFDRARRRSVFIGMFPIFSILATCPGFYFRGHYFLLILPVVALLSGIAISAISGLLSKIHSASIQRALPISLAIICLSVSVYQQRRFLFQMTPVQACRAVYGLNPFPESVEIGSFIRANTKASDQIAVMGSEPQIYFYSGRRSATGHIYMYPLMAENKFALQMQEEMIEEIEKNQPKFLVFVAVSTSWLQIENSHTLLFEWFRGYCASDYSLVGLVELSDNSVQYYWGPNAKWPPDSPFWVSVLERTNL
jgi:hypothetical protein